MPLQYPWYTIVEGSQLEQGDILLHCSLVVPVTQPAIQDVGNTIVGDIVTHDVIVMTQSCDLTHEGKLDDVILCPHWSIKDASQMDPGLAKNKALEIVRKGYRPRYHLLAASDQADMMVGARIIDFGRVFSLPKSYLQEYAGRVGKRLRLCPPYREHMSQAFARYFMRVGLPQDIELPN